MKINADLGVKLSTQTSSFELLNKNESQYLLFAMTPKVSFYKGNSYLAIGSDFSFINGKMQIKTHQKRKPTISDGFLCRSVV